MSLVTEKRGSLVRTQQVLCTHISLLYGRRGVFKHTQKTFLFFHSHHRFPLPLAGLSTAYATLVLPTKTSARSQYAPMVSESSCCRPAFLSFRNAGRNRLLEWYAEYHLPFVVWFLAVSTIFFLSPLLSVKFHHVLWIDALSSLLSSGIRGFNPRPV